MKIIISKEQLMEVRELIDEQSSWSLMTAERIYTMIKNIPFHDRKDMIRKIAKMIDK